MKKTRSRWRTATSTSRFALQWWTARRRPRRGPRPRASRSTRRRRPAPACSRASGASRSDEDEEDERHPAEAERVREADRGFGTRTGRRWRTNVPTTVRARSPSLAGAASGVTSRARKPRPELASGPAFDRPRPASFTRATSRSSSREPRTRCRCEERGLERPPARPRSCPPGVGAELVSALFGRPRFPSPPPPRLRRDPSPQSP